MGTLPILAIFGLMSLFAAHEALPFALGVFTFTALVLTSFAFTVFAFASFAFSSFAFAALASITMWSVLTVMLRMRRRVTVTAVT